MRRHIVTDMDASAGLFAPCTYTDFARRAHEEARFWLKWAWRAKRQGKPYSDLRAIALLASHRARIARQRCLTRTPARRFHETLDWNPGEVYRDLITPQG